MEIRIGKLYIKTPDRKPDGTNKIPFLTALVTGLLAYGYIMLNKINNHDNIAVFSGFGTGISSGRWGLQVLGDMLKNFWGNYNIPLFCGIVAVLLLAVSASAIVRMLRLRTTIAQVACSAVFTAFPAMGSAMLYIYTVHYYAFAVLLSVAGAWAADKFRIGFLPAAVLFAFSLGIYQAYVPLAAALMLLMLFRQCEDEGGVGSVLSAALRDLAALVLGFVLYFVLLRLYLEKYHVELSGYRSINEMGTQISIIPQMVMEAYKRFILLPFHAYRDLNVTSVIRLAMGLCLGAGGGSLLLWLIRSRTEPGKKILALAFLALLPLAVNSIFIMCATAEVESMLSYASVTVFFLPMVTLQSYETAAEDRGESRTRLLSGTLAAVVLLAAVNYGWQANGVYMTQELTNWQTKMYFETILTRLKGAEGYRQDLKLAVIGDVISDDTYKNFAYQRSTPFRFRGMDESELNVYSRDQWLMYYFGFNQPAASEEETAALAAREEVRAMPRYPDDGSIQVLEGYLVLKLEDISMTEGSDPS